MYTDRRALSLLFLGFFAGLSLPLVFDTLSVWLKEAGASRSSITFFSWVALTYSFKFIWSPLVDNLNLPWLGKRFGQWRPQRASGFNGRGHTVPGLQCGHP